ncbi:MAG: peptidoglycan DD-metalloendopeptidase family protein [Propionivibrio sp.]|uniref:M23 family metallopeptidase n=1 Tax=Propionivibrio sp. TaxID=2212460 RepID=UPI001B6E6AAD|nr:M23 family metallopeptidase [Propionivibrio sp.]MBP7201871.1 peptidoglycan DD-metalloendopeptidase family protein [Propionivibrio sp.]
MPRTFAGWGSVALCALALTQSPPSWALPRESAVPGGIALVRLGTAVPGAATPRAWLGEQRVWVSVEGGQWTAVVGLALDLPPGSLKLRVEAGEQQRQVDFVVRPKTYPEQHIRLKDSSKVTLSPADEARAVAEIAEIQQFKRHWRSVGAEDAVEAQFVLPANGRLASRFGLRRFFNGEARAPHSGLDVAIRRGTPVNSTARGTVLAVDDYFFNGKTVFVDHGNGVISMYCHLDRIDLQAGDPVSQGQRVGLSGMTGRASGPHLHWSMVLNGVMVDPALFIERAP